MKKANLIFIAVLLVILVVAPLLSSLLNLYIDWLFFAETGYTAVFTKTLTTQIAAGFLFGLLFLGAALVNLYFARRVEFSRPDQYNISGTPITINLAPLRTIQRAVTFFILLVVTFMMGKWGSSLWSEILLFANALNVGQNDPVFGRDIGFYLFQYPFFESLKQFVDFTLILCAILAGIVYFLGGGILVNQRQITIDPRVKRHLGILIGLMIINMGPGFYLEALRMLYAEHGVIFGASYTDVHAKLAAYRLLTFLAPAAGAVLIAGMFKRQRRLTMISLGALFAVYFIGIMIYPALLQKFKVAPQ